MLRERADRFVRVVQHDAQALLDIARSTPEPETRGVVGGEVGVGVAVEILARPGGPEGTFDGSAAIGRVVSLGPREPLRPFAISSSMRLGADRLRSGGYQESAVVSPVTSR